MSARTELAAALKRQLPANWAISGRAQTPDTVVRPTVIVQTERLERPTTARLHAFVAVHLAVWVLVAADDAEKADDALDAAATNVIDVIDRLASFDWTSAERGTLDAFHSFKISVQALLGR